MSGVSFSCPFWLTQLPVNPFVGEATTLTVRRVRQAVVPVLPGNTAQFLGRAEVQLQPGLGIPSDSAAVPELVMIWSGDSGKTWGQEHILSLGREGQYYVRAYQHTVGRVRQPVCRLTVSDDVNATFTDLFITRDTGLN
jgi:hypothetical protein